jgi:hypothetical protein
MSRKSRRKPEYWRQRAEQALTAAKSAPDIKTLSALMGFATGYEALAERARKILDRSGADARPRRRTRRHHVVAGGSGRAFLACAAE